MGQLTSYVFFCYLKVDQGLSKVGQGGMLSDSLLGMISLLVTNSVQITYLAFKNRLYHLFRIFLIRIICFLDFLKDILVQKILYRLDKLPRR